MAVSIGPERVEPNLTPLLDVVLQLIMFFMITVNFVSDQVNQNVVLPTSESAQEIMATGDLEKLVVNIEVVRKDRAENGQVVRDETGRPIRELVKPKTIRIIFAGSDEITFKESETRSGLGKAQKALADKADAFRVQQARRLAKPLKEIHELHAQVVFRADVEARYGLVYPLIAQCQREGFSKVEVGVLGRTK